MTVLDNLLGIELGRGGFGIIYTKKDDPSMCIKVSHKKKSQSNSNSSSNGCRQWSNEYKKIVTFMSLIEQSPLFPKFKHVKVLKPVEFKETSDLCYMVLPRVYRPEGRDEIKPTLQAQLGWPSGRMVHKGRGEFIGLKEVRELFSSEEELEQACYELGVMMGLIHFVGKNDAYDVELYIGKEARTKKCRFYLADFDLSEEVKDFNDETISRITWSLDAVPYFPTEDSSPKLFDRFKEGYTLAANNDEVVDTIFDTYG